jgi:hypothetical protein
MAFGLWAGRSSRFIVPVPLGELFPLDEND